MDKVRNPVIYFFLLTRGLGYIWTVISRFLNLLSTATANTNIICTYSRLNIYIILYIYIDNFLGQRKHYGQASFL